MNSLDQLFSLPLSCQIVLFTQIWKSILIEKDHTTTRICIATCPLQLFWIASKTFLALSNLQTIAFHLLCLELGKQQIQSSTMECFRFEWDLLPVYTCTRPNFLYDDRYSRKLDISIWMPVWALFRRLGPPILEWCNYFPVLHYSKEIYLNASSTYLHINGQKARRQKFLGLLHISIPYLCENWTSILYFH